VTFPVLLHPKATKALEKLNKQTKSRIVAELRGLADQPEKVGKQLRHSDFWSLRVGDYRVIYEIDMERNQVVILFIGHRKNVYDDFSKML
jgi:mRNA interferase RelE/StbE